jgi:hypothetical protein
MPTAHLISGLPCSGKTTHAVGLRADANCVLLEERNTKLPKYNFHIDPETLQGFLALFEVPSDNEGAEIVVVRNLTQRDSTVLG